MSMPVHEGPQLELRIREVTILLAGYRYLFADEVQLHEAMAEVLSDRKILFEREKILDAKNRADFWLPDVRAAIEVKVDGSLSEAIRQVDRYCHLDQVRGVLLASTKLWAAQPLKVRPKLAGKAFGMAYLRRQAL
jgi:hypothetical protein